MPLTINKDGFIHDGYSHARWNKFMLEICPDLKNPNFGWEEGTFNISNIIRKILEQSSIKENIEILDAAYNHSPYPTEITFTVRDNINTAKLHFTFNAIKSINDYAMSNVRWEIK